MASTGSTLDIPALESWLWEAACIVRGPLDAPKFKDYILPLVFLKRLSDVFADEIEHLGERLGDRKVAARLVEQDHKLVRFYVPEVARWEALKTKTTGLGQYLTDAVRGVSRENPRLQGVIDTVDFNATTAGQRIVDDQRLVALVQVLGQHRLGLDDVEPDILGRAYEYLLRKFAEGQGQSAGEFYTPREVAVLIALLIDPQPSETVYDPCCGSGGLLIKCHLRLLEAHGEKQNGRLKLPADVAPLKSYGQEINPSTFAMARMNAFIHDMEAEIALGDTMRHPAFTEVDGRLKRFDVVVANPMWNQNFSTSTYEQDPYERFPLGVPPASSADWGWIQHMYASLNERGRAAIVLDSGAVGRGSGNQGSNREREIRRVFIDGNLANRGDLVETVVLLPDNLFYNTPSPAVVLVLNKAKRHPGKTQLINAAKMCAKGRPKNYLTDADIDHITRIFHNWEAEPGVSVVIENTEAARNDYNLSPGRYVARIGEEETVPLEEAVVLLREAHEERSLAEREMALVLNALGLDLEATTAGNGSQ
ncbi:MAG: type I restriction-modification system subunit M [Chloroflexota bacterium]